MGDMSARMQKKYKIDGPALGTFLFDNTNTTLHREAQATTDNRERYLTFCNKHKLVISNSFFDKPAYKLLTYKENTHPGGPPLSEVTMKQLNM